MVDGKEFMFIFAKWRVLCKTRHCCAMAKGKTAWIGVLSPDISWFARNANCPERRLAVGFMAATTLKAD
jgi:hypothetical protein